MMHKDGFPRKQRHSEHGHEGKFAYLLLVVALEDVTEWKRWSVGQLPKSLCHGMPSRWVDCLQHVSAVMSLFKGMTYLLMVDVYAAGHLLMQI